MLISCLSLYQSRHRRLYRQFMGLAGQHTCRGAPLSVCCPWWDLDKPPPRSPSQISKTRLRPTDCKPLHRTTLKYVILYDIWLPLCSSICCGQWIVGNNGLENLILLSSDVYSISSSRFLIAFTRCEQHLLSALCSTNRKQKMISERQGCGGVENMTFISPVFYHNLLVVQIVVASREAIFWNVRHISYRVECDSAK